VRTGVIVLSEPLIDDDLSLLCRCEPFGVERCCQSNANQSLKWCATQLSGRQLAPFGHGRSAVLLESFAAVEMAVEIEMIVDRSMN
jgi:hypothetical protein